MQKKLTEMPKEKTAKQLNEEAIQALQKQDVQTAFSCFRKMYDADNDLLEAYLGIGIIWAKKGDLQRAIKFFIAGMSRKTPHTIDASIQPATVKETLAFNLAQCFVRVGKKAQAIQIYKDMIRLNSRFTPQIQQQLKIMGVAGGKAK